MMSGGGRGSVDVTDGKGGVEMEGGAWNAGFLWAYRGAQRGMMAMEDPKLSWSWNIVPSLYPFLLFRGCLCWDVTLGCPGQGMGL